MRTAERARLTGSHPPPEPGWLVVGAAATVSIPVDVLGRMVRDTPSWPLWDPGLARADHLAGEVSQPGMLVRLTLDWLSSPVVHMLVGTSEGKSVFAGGGRRWYFIETISVTGQGRSSARIERTMEIRPCGALRWVAPLIRAYAGRHLRRAFAALT